jgi:hypothetical protein
MFSDKHLHKQSPRVGHPRGEVGYSPVLLRVTLHRSLFPVTSVSRAGDAIRPFIADGRCHRGQMLGPE